MTPALDADQPRLPRIEDCIHSRLRTPVAEDLMSFRDLLVVLRPYPAGTPDPAVDYAVATAVALGAQTSAIACGITPKVPCSILGNALLDISAMVADERIKSSTDAQRLLKRFEEAVATNQGVLGE